MLSASLLTDEGRHNLSKKMQEIVDMLKKNPMTMMELKEDDKSLQTTNGELLEEELLLTNALNSMKLHGKAKLVIFSHLEKLERQRSKERREDARDMHELEVDFAKVQQELFDMLILEDPVEAKKLGIMPGHNVVAGELGVGQVEDDEDNGLETQVAAIVEKYN